MTDPNLRQSNSSKIVQYDNKLQAMIDSYEREWCTTKHGEYYYYSHKSGSKGKCIMFRQQSFDGESTEFLIEGEFPLRQKAWTLDGTILAYAQSDTDTSVDGLTVRFIKSPSGEILNDVIVGVQHNAALAWMPDNSGIFYLKYEKDEVEIGGWRLKHHSLCLHRIGSAQYEDQQIVNFTQHPLYDVKAYANDDNRQLIVEVTDGDNVHMPNVQYYYEFVVNGAKPLRMMSIFGRMTNHTPLFFNDVEQIAEPYVYNRPAVYKLIRNAGNCRRLLLTNVDAPNFKLISFDVYDRHAQWTTIIAERPLYLLHWVQPVDDELMIAAYVEDVKHVLYVYDRRSPNAPMHRLPVEPSIGSVTGYFGRRSYHEFFFAYESHLIPAVIYRLDFSTTRKPLPTIVRESFATKFDRSQFKVDYRSCASNDGASVRLYLLSSSQLLCDASREGYMIVSVCLNLQLPSFSIETAAYLQYAGGVVAIPSLRKTNAKAADDLISAADFLHDNKFISNRLTIEIASDDDAYIKNKRNMEFVSLICWRGCCTGKHYSDEQIATDRELSVKVKEKRPDLCKSISRKGGPYPTCENVIFRDDAEQFSSEKTNLCIAYLVNLCVIMCTMRDLQLM